MSAAVTVLATLVSPAGRRDEVLAALQDLQAAATADEPGTSLFMISEHRDEPGTFSVFERYEGDTAVADHRGSAAMERFRAALVELGIRPTLIFMAPVDPA